MNLVERQTGNKECYVVDIEVEEHDREVLGESNGKLTSLEIRMYVEND